MALLTEALDEDTRAESVIAKLDAAESAEAAAGAQTETTTQGAENATEQNPVIETGAGAETPTGQEAGPEPAKPAIEPPQFLKAEFKTRWAELAPDWQEYLAHQEAENSKTVSTKLNEAATQRKAAEQRAEALGREQQTYAQNLQVLTQTIAALDPVIARYHSVDLPKLARENPAEYAALEADYRQHSQYLRGIITEQQRAQNEALAGHMAAQETALREKLPEWADPAVGTKAINDLRQFAVKNYGYTPQELTTIADHRLVLMARDAARYHELLAQTQAKEQADAAARATLASKRVVTAPKVVRPNASNEGERVQGDRNKAVLKQVRGTRSMSDKAALIAEII